MVRDEEGILRDVSSAELASALAGRCSAQLKGCHEGPIIIIIDQQVIINQHGVLDCWSLGDGVESVSPQ